MRHAAAAFAVLVTALLVACGGTASTPTPSGGSTPAAGVFTPTPTANTAPAEVLKFAISADDSEIIPKEVTIKAGKNYKVEFTNGGKRAHAFVAQRWQIDLFVQAGQSKTSDSFAESAPNVYNCFDRFDAARNPNVKCTITVE